MSYLKLLIPGILFLLCACAPPAARSWVVSSTNGEDLELPYDINKTPLGGYSALQKYKLDPAQKAPIVGLHTSSGYKIAATTVLNDEGVRVQKESGCKACHPY